MTPTADVTVPRDQLTALARSACRGAGASPQVADLLVDAALFAEDRGLRGVGVPHLLDYLRAIKAGRMDGQAVPEVTRLSPGIIACDARGGSFHAGFEAAAHDLVAAARELGVAMFLQSGAFASGQLGWFAERLAIQGLVALAAINSHALLATQPGTGRVLGTNPLAYSLPRPDDQVMTVDQSSSTAAYVNVRAAADRGEPIPETWAVDAAGEPTTDAVAALAGSMLPFGGYKGANIAWLVELLAGMSGANWSIDAPAFDDGAECPSVGMFVLAIDPDTFPHDYLARVDAHVTRLAGLGVRTPGTSRAEPLPAVVVAREVLDELRSHVATD